MRCQHCHRRLTRPGVKVPMYGINGPDITVGPVCAQKLGYQHAPDPKRSAVQKIAALFRRPRRAERVDGQMDLFGGMV